MAVQIDTPYLGAYLSIPEPSLQTLLVAPTSDLVQSVLQQIAVKAKEHEQARADQLKLEVELETVARNSETKSRAQRVAVDKAAAEVASLRQRVADEETSRAKVENELQILTGSISASDHDTSALKARVASLESTNRETLQLLHSKTSAYDDVSNELIAKQQKINELRSELSRLEQAAQNANSASTAAKMREQTNQQEIDMLRRSNDWLDRELKTKSEELTKFRKEKNSQLAELQRQNEDATSQIESQQRTEASLQSRVEETTQKIDQLLVQIKDLREEADRNEENLRAELDTAKRLEKLMEESLHTEKARKQDLNAQLEQLRDDAAEEVGRITAEVETEHQDRLSAEERVAELESQLEELRSHDARPPVTPRNGHSGSQRGTPVPDATPSKRGVSLTQLVTENHALKSKLDEREQRVEKLERTMDEMLQAMEAREPEISEMQADYERSKQEVLEMSKYADKIRKEYEEARKHAKAVERETEGLVREGEILRQQLRDLSSQVKILLMEINVQSQGSAPFTAEQRAQLESLARGDLDSNMADPVTDTSRFISEHLTTFRSVAELADQNSKLLRLTRELGEKMEGDEAQAQRSQAAQNLEELEDLREKYERCKDEISSLLTQSQSYIKERDMFRRMLSHRGQLPRMSDVGSMFDESVNGQRPDTPSQNLGVSQAAHSPNSKDIEDYRKLLKEMQSHFDNYRQESASDRTALKQQLDDATKKSGELRNELSKKLGELTLAHERYEMLQGNFKMLKAENAELQRRSTLTSEKASKQDLRAQQVTEELIEAKGTIESIRNESANLKAEKDFWKAVETRLTADNNSLQADRDRLNELNANLQKLLNQREHVDSEVRRRLESQVESFEVEIKSLKRRLTEEQEENKRLAQRREHESSQTQTRTDELNLNLATTREELVAAKTARDHLQTRVDELSIELRSAVEKIEVLQQRPINPVATGGELLQPTDGSITKEQELTMQVLELKKNLDLVQTELASARQQVEQYKEISATSEEELRSFSQTHDQYQQEMDKLIQEKDSRLQLLEQDLETLRAELAARNTELNEIRAENAQSSHKMEDQKVAYEAEISKIKDLQERAESAAQYHQQDLKSQAEIAQQAQQNYENELMKHAEAAKILQKVRNEYHQLKINNMEISATVETTTAKLAQNEESWNEARDRYERELVEMRKRKEDVGAQNKILHDQLENLNKQIASLQRSNYAVADTADTEEPNSNLSEVANLQELIRYLRREKDILDVQHDLATQEARRLRQQLEHTQSQLEETRLKLSQQRSTQDTTELHALNHKKLMDTIEELNLNRESNSTLRTEKQQLQVSMNEKASQIEELQGQISPLQARISELEDQHEALTQELRMTSEARARFEQRYLDLLNRSNTIDPADFESIQQQLKAAEEERDTLKQSESELKSQIDTIPEKIKAGVDEANKGFQESRQKLIEQSKNRDRTQSARIKEKDAALQEALQEKTKLEEHLKESQSELEKARHTHEEQMKYVQEEAQKKLQSHSEQLAKKSEDARKDVATPNADVTGNAQQIKEMAQKAEAAEAQTASANLKVQELENQVVQLKQKLSEAQKTIEKLQTEKAESTQAATKSDTAANEASATEEHLRRELAETQQELEQKVVDLLSKESAATITQDSEGPSVEEQIRARVNEIQAELQRRHEERVSKAEESYKTRLESMKQLLSKKLAEGKVEISKRLENAHATAIVALKEEHSQQIQDLKKRNEEELTELRRLTAKPENTPTTGALPASQAIDNSAQTSEFLTQLGESDIKTILSQHEVARRMVLNSLTKRENKAREEQASIWTQKLADVEAKARKDQEQAIAMEGKKHVVKLNIADNKAKSANAKIEVIQQAAKDTPEKSVGEVWEVAKLARPPPAVPAASSLNQSIHASPAAPKSHPIVSNAKQPVVAGAKADTSNATKEAPAQVTSAPAVSSETAAEKKSTQTPNGTAAGAAQITQSQAPATTNQAKVAEATPAAAATNQVTEQRNKTADEKPKALDQPLPDAKAGQSVPASKPQQSGIPVPGGRGSGIPAPASQRGGASNTRGRGRGGAGRGGVPTVNTTAAQAAAQSKQPGSSPRNMNPTAKQFVPKTRKRDADGAGLESSVHAGETKRAKPEGGDA